jgi:hypothetical protein
MTAIFMLLIELCPNSAGAKRSPRSCSISLKYRHFFMLRSQPILII